MNMNVVMAALVYASSLILLALSFTLTYTYTRVPNYTIGPVMAIGGYIGFTNTKLLGYPVYLGLPIAFIACSILSSIIYTTIIQPLIRRKRSEILITLATLGVGLALTGLLEVYAFWVKDTLDLWAVSFLLKEYDFHVGVVPGVFLVSSFMVFSLAVSTRYVRKTSFGVSYRALLENYILFQVQGLNPERYLVIYWGFAGGFAGLTGALMSLWFKTTPVMGIWIMTPILAASLVGGFDNLKGAFIGGLFVGFSDIVLTILGQSVFGVWFGAYRPLLSVGFLVLFLLFRPQGILGMRVNDIKYSQKQP
jgi:branched-subunit amino acid ABC-type transport system permease component